MKRGEIYYIQSNGGEGIEGKGRPAVIVSNDRYNATLNTVEVVYMTTHPQNDLPTHVFVRSTGRPSTLLCEQVYTVYKDRIGDRIGELTREELTAIETALMISLDLEIGSVQVMREPTEDELKELLKQMQSELPTPTPVPAVSEDTKLALVKAETERDLYKQLYENMLSMVTNK